MADNGSTDGSPALAEAAGARVVAVPGRGVRRGARGRVRGRARARTSSWATRTSPTTSAPCPSSSKALEAGADLVMGSRFAGRIEDGAMPPLHRWLGNPVLSGLGRLFFRTDVSDFHCGLRGVPPRRARRSWICGRPAWSTRARWSSRRRSSDLAIARCPSRSARTAARARPTCARGATAGGTCASCSSTRRAGSSSCPGFSSRSSARASSSGSCPGRAPRSARPGTSTPSSAAPRWSSSAPRRSSSARARRSSGSRKASSRRTLSSSASSTGGSRSRRASPCRSRRSSPALSSSATSSSAWSAAGFHDLAYGTTMRWMIPGVLFLVLGAEGAFGSFLLSLLGVRRR